MTTFHPGGGGSSLTSAGNSIPCHAELVSASHNKEIPKQVQDDKYVNEAHSKELNVLTSYRLNDFKKKAGATHVDMSDNIRRVAFTLAEVLITLAIIGVVAAMTIPTLIADYQEKQTVTKLTDAYAIMSNAYALAMVEKGPISGWFPNAVQGGTEIDEETGEITFDENMIKNADTFLDIIAPYLKVISQCKGNDQSCPKHEKTYTLNGAERITDYKHFSYSTLANGVIIRTGSIKIPCDTLSCGDFSVDINGFTGPNANGKDIFYFYINSDGIVPIGKNDDRARPFEDYCNMDADNEYNGYGCSAWVIYNKNTDYLHCNDLSWDGKHKCSE